MVRSSRPRSPRPAPPRPRADLGPRGEGARPRLLDSIQSLHRIREEAGRPLFPADLDGTKKLLRGEADGEENRRRAQSERALQAGERRSPGGSEREGEGTGRRGARQGRKGTGRDPGGDRREIRTDRSGLPRQGRKHRPRPQEPRKGAQGADRRTTWQEGRRRAGAAEGSDPGTDQRQERRSRRQSAGRKERARRTEERHRQAEDAAQRNRGSGGSRTRRSGRRNREQDRQPLEEAVRRKESGAELDPGKPARLPRIEARTGSRRRRRDADQLGLDDDAVGGELELEPLGAFELDQAEDAGQRVPGEAGDRQA